MRGIVEKLIESALERCFRQGILEKVEWSGWQVEVPKRPEHGDYSANVAMILASKVRRRPLDIAKEIADRVEDPRAYIERIDVRPPGFINFFLNRNVLLDTLREVLRQGETYGRGRMGGGERVQVEFVSANPTGPLHIGHGRGAAVGDALANVLAAAGYEVSREYYVNDVGLQMEMLGRSVFLRYLQEAGQPVELPEDSYKGEYIVDLARDVLQHDGDRWRGASEDEAIPRFTEVARERILQGIREDLSDFRVEYDVWFRESSLYETDRIPQVLEGLRKRDLVYENDGAVWFRSSAFGDEKDRVAVRSDGRTTYFASDIAYHEDKFSRGFDKVINIWGADHHGYVSRMKGVIQALGRDPDALQVLLVQMVNLQRDGVPVAMSTRAGEFATLREVMEEVGVDAARYMFLVRSAESHLDFDLEVAKRQERANPVYYVQYAHARICSILNEAKQRGIPIPGPEGADLSHLRMVQEWELVKHLVLYPEVIQESAKRLEPHRITYFLDGLASDFHTYYNQGWLDSKARVICQDPELTEARLLLVQSLKTVLKSALGLLGVTAPEKM